MVQKRKEADEILAGASDYASGEFAGTDLSDKHKDVFLKARTERRIETTGDKAAEDYYRETGRHFDSDSETGPYIQIIAGLLVHLIFIFAINLILYLPMNYILLLLWRDISTHDAVFVTIIINTAIGGALTGIWFERLMKQKAFIAGMHAEARNRVVGEYHEAKTKLHTNHTTHDYGSVDDI